MTLTTEDRSTERSALPILWEPPAGVEGGGKAAYVPRHALESKPRFDRTNLWIWLLLFFTSSFVVGTTAAFNATVGDTGNAFGSASLGVPGAQTLTLSGSNLTASVASFGGFDGSGGTVGVRWRYYYPTGVSTQGTAPTCATANSSYPSVQDLGSSLTTSVTVDISGVSAGRWACVMAFTTYPAVDPVAPAVQWLSQAGNPRGAVQTGYVVQRVALANKVGGTAGTMESGDTITVTFNQNVDPGNGRPSSGMVCITKNGGAPQIIHVGTSSCGQNDPSSVTVLELVPKTDVTVSNGGSSRDWTMSGANWAWTDDRTLVITLAGSTDTVPIGGTGCTTTTTSCFTPSLAATAGTTSTATGNAAATLRSAGQPYQMLCKTQPVGAPDAGICIPDAIGRF